MSTSLRRRVAAPIVVAAFAVAPAARANVAPSFTLRSKTVWSAAQTLRGGEAYTPNVLEGGWSAFAPIDDNTYWTVSDRGPNGQPTVTGQTRRTFLAPAFTPTIYKVQITPTGLNVLQRIPLKLKATNPARAAVGGPATEVTGLPQIATAAQGTAAGLPAATINASKDEVPYAADGVTLLGTDPYGIDSESIAVDPRDGS